MQKAEQVQCRNKAEHLIRAAESLGEARADMAAYSAFSTMKERKPLQARFGNVHDRLRKSLEHFKIRCRPVKR